MQLQHESLACFKTSAVTAHSIIKGRPFQTNVSYSLVTMFSSSPPTIHGYNMRFRTRSQFKLSCSYDLSPIVTIRGTVALHMIVSVIRNLSYMLFNLYRGPGRASKVGPTYCCDVYCYNEPQKHLTIETKVHATRVAIEVDVRDYSAPDILPNPPLLDKLAVNCHEINVLEHLDTLRAKVPNLLKAAIGQHRRQQRLENNDGELIAFEHEVVAKI
jgi:hypothetical protein